MSRLAGPRRSSSRPSPTGAGRWRHSPEGAETELAAIGRLLGVLQRGATGEGVQAVLDGAPPVVEQLWRELVKGGLVPEATARPGLADGLEPGQIKHLGHATLLANLGGAFVLFDPWFIPGSASDGQQPPALCDLPELAGIFLPALQTAGYQVQIEDNPVLDTVDIPLLGQEIVACDDRVGDALLRR